MLRCVYPGTFDPMTKGHEDLVRRASRLFGEVVVGIVDSKRRPVVHGRRARGRWREVTKELPNVRVERFSSLLLDFVRSQNASIILRGLRAVSDFEYEFQMAGMNRGMDPSIEVVFLTPSESTCSSRPPSCARWRTSVGDFERFVHPFVAETR